MADPAGARIEEHWSNHQQQIDNDGYLRSATKFYIVHGFDNETDVLDYARRNTPDKITVQNRDVSRDSVEIEERLAEQIWKVAVSYPQDPENETDQGGDEVPEFSMDISGGTKHITHSKETIGSYSADENPAPDFQRAINVNDDNQVDGVDIVNCSFSFTEKHYYTNSKMSNSFKRQIASLVGKVNSNTFRQWETGELLFMGASGSRRGTARKDKWEVTFRFAVSMNATNIHVGESITIPSKNGWDYLWVKYADNVKNNSLVKEIKAAYVERVYDYESFTPLK
jgi:hypothetical protein